MILSVRNLNTDLGCILDIWMVGGKHRMVKAPIDPYFYSLRDMSRGEQVSRKPLSTLKSRRMWKVSFKDTQMLKSSVAPFTIEDNIPFVQRIAIDEGFDFPSKEPKVLAFDLEAISRGLGPNPNVDIIKSCAVWNDDYQDCFIGSELEVLKAFDAAVKKYDPDILAGYFSTWYDFPLLRQACARNKYPFTFGRNQDEVWISTTEYIKRGKIRKRRRIFVPGRVPFDVFVEVDQDQTLFGLKNKGLKTVAKHFNLNPVTVDRSKIAELSEEELREYNLSDARCTFELAKIYLKNLYTLSDLLKVPLNIIVQRSPSHIANYIYGRAYMEQDIVSDADNQIRYPRFFLREKRSYQGALVKLVRQGLFTPIQKLDFKSQYPSICICFNLSPETIRLKNISDYTGEHRFTKTEIEVPDEKIGQLICKVDSTKNSVTRKLLSKMMRATVRNLNTELGCILDVWMAGGKHRMVKAPIELCFYSLSDLSTCLCLSMNSCEQVIRLR